MAEIAGWFVELAREPWHDKPLAGGELTTPGWNAWKKFHDLAHAKLRLAEAQMDRAFDTLLDEALQEMTAECLATRMRCKTFTITRLRQSNYSSKRLWLARLMAATERDMAFIRRSR